MAAAMRVKRQAGWRLPLFPWWRCGFRLFELLDDDGRGVGNFFAGFNQDAFANEFGDHEALGLVGVLVFGVVALARGQGGDDFADEDVEAVALAGADGNDLGKVELAGERVDERKELILLHQIDFGEDEEDGAVELADEAEEELVFAGPVGASALGGGDSCISASAESGFSAAGTAGAASSKLNAAGGVHQHQHKVAGFESFVDLLQHAAVELRAGLVDAGSIDKDDLRGGICVFARGNLDHAHDAVARGLRLGGDNGYLFAGEGVEERAFADVGPAENGDKS